jgi:hypothetical protein
MTKQYVLETLRKEHLWKSGDIDTFQAELHQLWEFTIRKEQPMYFPYTYSLVGRKIGTHETWSRRYRDMDSAFLHIVNNLNENAAVKDKYENINQWLLKR